MSIKEQKLFFTRNRIYSIWEKLVHLEQQQLEALFNYCYSNLNPSGAPGVIEEYPGWLYIQYMHTPIDKKQEFSQKIEQFFSQLDEPLNDFNGIVYHLKGLLDKDSIIASLENVRSNEFELEGLEIDFFKRDESNQIDIRFKSPFVSRYKENLLEQFLNTEFRIYLDYNIIMVTNWSTYTHSDKYKNSFLEEIAKSSSMYSSELHAVSFSDALMRKLLLTGKHKTSKIKFSMENRLKVAIEMHQEFSLEEAVKQDEIKFFYNNGSLSVLKVILDESATKALIVDSEGKLISRAKNLSEHDIDLFVARLSPLLKYDYLNEDYRKKFREVANLSLNALKSRKNVVVDHCYEVLKQTIEKEINDSTSIFSSLIFNTFLFCMIRKIYLNDPKDKEVILDEKIGKYLAQIGKTETNNIVLLLNTLLKNYELYNDIENLMEKYDELITQYQRMI